jgi:anti-sigma B factor antagonist
MDIVFRELNNHHIMEISGEIDLYNASRLKIALFEAIMDKKITNLIVDMSGIPYMDSTALGALVAAHRKMKENKGNLAIACVKDEVMEVLRLASLNRYFKIYRNISEIIPPSKGNSAIPPVREDATIEMTIVDSTFDGSLNEGSSKINLQNGSRANNPKEGAVMVMDAKETINHSNHGSNAISGNQDEVIVFKGWVNEHTYRIAADGFPRPATTDILERKVESKKAAIKKAQMVIIESLVESFQHKNWMEFHKYRRNIYAKYSGIVKNGVAKLTKFDSRQNCSIIFEVKGPNLKKNIKTEFQS